MLYSVKLHNVLPGNAPYHTELTAAEIQTLLNRWADVIVEIVW